MTISVVDFFCGCGGTSAGLKAAGMNVLAGIDIDTVALKTFKRNFPNAKALQQDITGLSCEGLAQELGAVSGPLLFAACAPCQPFSKQNRYKTKKDDRVILLDEFHRFVEAFSPEYIILENVPGMQRVRKGPFIRFTEFLKKRGYFFDHDVKDAKTYGVPQSRRRLVLIASRLGPISLPTDTHGQQDGLVDYATVWGAIRSYHPLQAGQSSKKIPNHQAAQISDLNLTRLKHTPEGGDRRNWPKHLILDCHVNKSGYTDTYGRLKRDEPAKTLTTKCISISNGRFGHPTQNRGLTVREAAALQTFPDDFVFEGTLVQTARQVGNAVPVLVAKVLGEQVLEHYRHNSDG